jgi:hypothetical protein
MCSIEGCDGKAIAKGLCAKHYMRLRRTGDPGSERKRGRPRDQDEMLAMTRTMFKEFSPRTIARHVRASRLLFAVLDGKTHEEIIKSCIRPSGSFNFSKLLRLAELLYEAAHEDNGDSEE